ncbi:MAG: FecR domain-containing protein [Pseudomonadales bacterium]
MLSAALTQTVLRVKAVLLRRQCRVLAAIALLMMPTLSVAEDWLHTVRPGDSFWTICAELVEEPLCWQKLPAHNPQVTDPRQLPPGSQVKIPVEWLKAPPVPAAVEFVRGEAFLERRSGERKRPQPGGELRTGENYLSARNPKLNRTPLTAGEQLYMGDRIITSDGSVLLRFADDSSFLVRANSELVLERLSAHGQTGMIDTHMRLNRGSGRAKVNSRNGKSRYRISTPAAIAAARGTEFSISADGSVNGVGGILRNEVLEGIVEVSAAGGSQAVGAGFGTVAEQGKAPLPPVKLLAAPELNITENIELPFTLGWSAIENAEKYLVDVYSGQSTEQLLRSTDTEQQQVHFADLPTGAYTFVVRAVDAIGLKGLPAQQSVQATVALATPNLTAENILVDGTQVSISWPAIENAKSYKLQISRDKSFTDVVEEISVESNSTILSLPEGQQYYARTQAIYPAYGSGEFSNVQGFSSKVRDLWLIILQSLGILAVVLI